MQPVSEHGNVLFEEIDPAECLALMRTRPVGRLAVATRQGGPLVMPINFELDGSDIVFRTGPGSKLRLLHARPVSFQVDDIDVEARTGWSVLVRGWAHEVSRRDVTEVDVEPWYPQGRRHWVRMRIHQISGRRIVRPTGWPFDASGYL